MSSSELSEQDIRQLEESHLRPETRSNRAAMERLLAADFIEIGSSGRVIDRSDVLAAMPLDSPYRFAISDFSARSLRDEIVLTTYRLSVQMSEHADVQVTLRSSIWVRRDGRWQMVFHQGTPV